MDLSVGRLGSSARKFEKQCSTLDKKLDDKIKKKMYDKLDALDKNVTGLDNQLDDLTRQQARTGMLKLLICYRWLGWRCRCAENTCWAIFSIRIQDAAVIPTVSY